MDVSLIAIDLAKNTFQVCGVNRQGKEVFNRPTSRKKLTALIAQHPGIPIAMEARSGSNFWGRTFQKNGLTMAARRYLQDLLEEWRDLDEHIHESERAIRTLASESPTACVTWC